MRTLRLSLFVVSCLTLSVWANAQTCNEKTITDAVKSHGQELASDVYWMTGALQHPGIGREEAEASQKRVETERKNYKPIEDHPDKIVVSQSGDMAYEYGTREGHWTDTRTDKPVTLHGAYLRVWKADGGKCVVAGMASHHVE